MPSELGLSSTAWSTVTAKHFLQETLQFSGPSKFILHDGSIPRHYKLLLPDKQIASSESPDTHNGDGSPYDESSTTTSSPLSYTKELTNVSSPLTPLSDARRSKSKSPSQLAVVKSKFLEEEEDEQEKTLTNGSSRREEAAEDVPARKEGNPLPSTSKQFIGPQMPETKPSPAKVNGEKEEYSTPLNSPYKPKVMTIKIGNVTMAKKELTQPLVPYGEESSSGEESDEENTVQVRAKPSPMKPRAPSPQTIIGPLKPSKLPLPETKPIVQKRSAEGLTTPPVSKRKRLLSERGEKEMAYPIMDKSTISAWNWSNFQLLTGRPRGVGLYNSSNDCFLNAILQVVTHTPPLCRYLIERHDSRSCTRPNNQCVACGLAANHIRRALGTGSPFQATWIRSHLRRIFPSHIHGMQEDAHELLALLLDAIDPPITSSKNNIINGMNTKPSTPIEQIFGGTLRNQVTCEACGSVYTNYERIRELNLAIRKMRPDADHTKISYLIDLYFRDENVASFDCKHCAKKTTATRKTKILRPPAVLLVQLKRFNAYGQKIRLPVTPEIDIDLTKFMFDGAPPSCTEYVLTSVVEHLGATVDHGHYIAYCRGFDHKQWFHFDDETVTGVSSQKVSSSNPYLLVYSRREDMPFHSGKKLENGTIRIPKSPYQKQNGFTTKYNGYSNGNFSRQPFRI